MEEKELNLFKIQKIQEYAEYIKKELENDLKPNKVLIDGMVEWLLDIRKECKK